MQLNPALVAAQKSIQSLYLNTHEADVWFIINEERIPGHKLILSAMCPYYKKMFYGTNEVNMTVTGRSVESFKEFLKFMYMRQPDLSMDNIEDVIGLVKQSQADECLSACEKFLKDSLTAETIYRVYQVAVSYDLDKLKAACKDEICVMAENVFKSSSLLDFPYEFLQMILQRDDLACEEANVLNACIAWAKAACKRSNLDPSNGKCLRDQLRDLVYQIRFTSMAKRDASNCMRLYPGLFTVDELEEIFCMVALDGEFQPKQFNWSPRYFDLNWNKGRHLRFSRVQKYIPESNIAVNELETTRFSCNRRVLLKSFYCGIGSPPPLELPLHVIIKESRENENVIHRYDQRLTAYFKKPMESNRNHSTCEAEIVLDKPILLRPTYDYDIRIKFDSVQFQYEWPPRNCAVMATKKRIDEDIVFRFDKNGIVTGLSVCRFDDRNDFQKIFCNPETWMIAAASTIISLLGFSYFKHRSLFIALGIPRLLEPHHCFIDSC